MSGVMLSKNMKSFLAGIFLVLLVMLFHNFFTQTATKQVDTDNRAMLKRPLPQQLSQAQWQPLQSPRKNQPKPQMVVDWSDAVGYFRKQWMNSPDIKCKKIENAGNWKICQDEMFEVKPPCLVYSFGINVDWSFDEHMGTKGCEVHAFDPSIGKEDHIHSPGNVSFHNLGVGARDTDTHEPELDEYVETKTYWKVRTVKSIMKMLGHEGRKLDVLKMDIETDEWETLINMVDTGLLPDIKQFLVEWHLFNNYPNRNRYSDYYNAYKDFRNAGFQSYYSSFHRNTFDFNSLRFQADMDFLNSKYQN